MHEDLQDVGVYERCCSKGKPNSYIKLTQISLESAATWWQESCSPETKMGKLQFIHTQ